MHHAKRSVLAVRSHSRTAATAAKPAYNAPGKWARPDSLSEVPSESAGAQPLPVPTRWSAPSHGRSSSPHSTAFRPRQSSDSSPLPLQNRRTRDHRGDRSDNPSANIGFGLKSNTNTSNRGSFSNAPLPSHSKWGSQNGTFPTSSNSTHLSRSHLQSPQPRFENPTSLDFLHPPPSKAKNSKTAPERGPKSSLADGVAASHEPSEPLDHLDRPLAGLAGTDMATIGRQRPKASRTTFKERGSLAALAAADVTIPSHPRKKLTADLLKERKKETKRKVNSLQAAKVDVFIPTVISVSNLARLLNIRLGTLQRKMAQVGMGGETSHDHMLSSDYSSLLALEFRRNPVVDDEAAFDIHPSSLPKDKSSLPMRPPVVTIMGHVDHGKTTLLDTLRSTSVAKGEAGGITQHIGAFSVPVKGEVDRTITFLDTPGHAAFSAMRARGAGVTDIIVLVVAADDGIMPQTREVLSLVQKEGDKVGLVVAINKVDKPGADVEKVESALFAEGVQLESFDGDIPCVHVSGLTGQGLDHLVETISVVAEMQDLRAEKSGPIHGYVLESKVQKGLGPVATVLLLRGALTPGQHLICGTTHAKVRLLTSPTGQQVKKAYPGDAVVVSGWKELPSAGDDVLDGAEADIKKALANRIRKAEIEATLQDVEAINLSRREERERREEAQSKATSRNPAPEAHEEHSEEKQFKELRIVVKGDVSGSVEAVAGALQSIGNHQVGVKVVATGVGEVTESDIMRAKAAEGMIIAFSVKAPKAIESLASGESVPILASSVIYQLVDKVKERLIDLLPVTIERRVKGEATVLEVFEIQLKAKKIMKVAGCRVASGVVEKNKHARILRDEKIIYEGRLDTLRHLKKDIAEAGKGLECGMSFENFFDLRANDVIQAYEEVEIRASL